MHAKTLANIKVRAVFHMRDILRNVLPKFMEICMDTPCAQPHGHQCRSGKSTETSVTEFCYESVNRPIWLAQCCTQFKPFGNKTSFFRNFHIMWECHIITQIQDTKNFNHERFELGTTLSLRATPCKYRPKCGNAQKIKIALLLHTDRLK